MRPTSNSPDSQPDADRPLIYEFKIEGRLHGILKKVRDLGPSLLSVNRVQK